MFGLVDTMRDKTLSEVIIPAPAFKPLKLTDGNEIARLSVNVGRKYKQAPSFRVEANTRR